MDKPENPWSDFIENLDMSGIIPNEFFTPSNETSPPPVGDEWPVFKPDEYEELMAEEFESFITNDTSSDWDAIPEIQQVDYEEAQKKGIESSIDYISYLCKMADEDAAGIESIMDKSDNMARDAIEAASVKVFNNLKNKNLKTSTLFTTIVMLMSFEVIQTLLKIDEDLGKND